MLVLSRKKEQTVVIKNGSEVVAVVKVLGTGSNVRLGIEAPELKIVRGEIERRDEKTAGFTTTPAAKSL